MRSSLPCVWVMGDKVFLRSITWIWLATWVKGVAACAILVCTPLDAIMIEVAHSQWCYMKDKFARTRVEAYMSVWLPASIFPLIEAIG